MSNQRKPWKTALWVAVGVAALILSCLFGAALMDGDSDQPDPVATEQAFPEPVGEAGPPSSAPTEKPAPKPSATIGGDDVVQAGTDVPAGTYRAATAIDGPCYWKKSRDAEGSSITDIGFPSGGRPQVTLKSGQWFTSDGCPDWIKK